MVSAGIRTFRFTPLLLVACGQSPGDLAAVGAGTATVVSGGNDVGAGGATGLPVPTDVPTTFRERSFISVDVSGLRDTQPPVNQRHVRQGSAGHPGTGGECREEGAGPGDKGKGERHHGRVGNPQAVGQQLTRAVPSRDGAGVEVITRYPSCWVEEEVQRPHRHCRSCTDGGSAGTEVISTGARGRGSRDPRTGEEANDRLGQIHLTSIEGKIGMTACLAAGSPA